MRAIDAAVVVLLASLFATPGANAQTTFFDFEDAPPDNYPTTWGSFGPNTLDRGYQPFCENDFSICRWHLATYDDALDASFFGTVNISPVVDLTGFGGYQVDVRLVKDTGAPVPPPLVPILGPGLLAPFTGAAPFEMGLELEFGDATSEVYAEPVELTETFQTITVDFADFVPGGADLSAVQFKMRLLSIDEEGNPINDGSAIIEYDNIVALPAVQIAGDYNGDGSIDIADYTAWRDTEGSVVTPGTGADGNGDGQIDSVDYDYWTANFGRSSVGLVSNTPPAAVAVPEPSTVIAAVAMTIGVFWRRS